MAGRDSSRVIRLVLTADSKGAVRAFKQVDDASEGTTKNLEGHAERSSRSFGSVAGSIGKLGLIAGSVGVGAVGALAYGMYGATKAAISMGSQQALLANSLKNTGIYSTQTMGKLSDLANTMAAKGGFGAQENIQSLTQLTRVTGSAATATRDFALATDVARGSHKDLLQATKALAMVEQGRTTGLARMGIVLPKGATPAQAMQILQQRFGGATAAFSNTAAGGMQNLGQSFDVLKENLGKAFLPLVTTVTRTLTGLMPQISRAFDAIAKPLSATLQKLLPPLLNALVQILPPILGLVDSVIPPLAQILTSVLPVVTNGIRQILPVFQQALGVVVPLLSQLVSYVVHQIATLIPPILRVFSQVMPILTNAFQIIAPPLMRALSTVVTALAPVITQLVTSLAPIFPMLANAIAQILPPLARAITAMMPALTQAITALLPPFVKAFDALVPPLTQALIKLMPAITLLANAVAAVAGHIGKDGVMHFGGKKPSTLDKIGNFIFNPFGRFNQPQKHALGGIIGGVGGADSQLSWMSPGEGVLTPPAVQAVGGQSGLNSLNTTGHLNGRQLPDRDIVINLKAVLGQRIVAEECIRYGLRKVALSQ
jgi:hypothetical protein